MTQAATSFDSQRSESEAMLRLLGGVYIAQAISVAARLSITDHLLSGPMSSAALAATCGADALALHRLMRALTSVGLFVETADGGFAVAPLGASLCAEGPGNLAPFATWIGEEWHLRAVSGLLHTVRTGEPAFTHVLGMPLYAFLAQDAQAAAVFDAAITSRARQENSAVVAAYDWPDGTIVDVGGGQGALLAAILEARPKARGILFELPHVAMSAQTFIESQGLTERCACSGGDAFDHVPEGGDVYILRRVLHGQDDARATAILRNCRTAMRASSRLLVIEHALQVGGALSWGKILDLQMLVLSAGGRERGEAEFSALLTAAGLTKVRALENRGNDKHHRSYTCVRQASSKRRAHRRQRHAAPDGPERAQPAGRSDALPQSASGRPRHLQLADINRR